MENPHAFHAEHENPGNDQHRSGDVEIAGASTHSEDPPRNLSPPEEVGLDSLGSLPLRPKSHHEGQDHIGDNNTRIQRPEGRGFLSKTWAEDRCCGKEAHRSRK